MLPTIIQDLAEVPNEALVPAAAAPQLAPEVEQRLLTLPDKLKELPGAAVEGTSAAAQQQSSLTPEQLQQHQQQEPHQAHSAGHGENDDAAAMSSGEEDEGGAQVTEGTRGAGAQPDQAAAQDAGAPAPLLSPDSPASLWSPVLFLPRDDAWHDCWEVLAACRLPSRRGRPRGAARLAPWAAACRTSHRLHFHIHWEQTLL